MGSQLRGAGREDLFGLLPPRCSAAAALALVARRSAAEIEAQWMAASKEPMPFRESAWAVRGEGLDGG